MEYSTHVHVAISHLGVRVEVKAHARAARLAVDVHEV
jgi:hypothetical protein